MIAQQDMLPTKTKGANARLYTVLGGLYLAQGIPTYLLLVALPH